MFKPLTPNSDPAEIEAFVEIPTKLAPPLNTDAKAKRVLEDAGQGKLGDLDLALGLAVRLAAAEDSEKHKSIDKSVIQPIDWHTGKCVVAK
jgi:hypothetical protein